VGSPEDPAEDMDGRFLVGSGESESKWVGGGPLSESGTALYPLLTLGRLLA